MVFSSLKKNFFDENTCTVPGLPGWCAVDYETGHDVIGCRGRKEGRADRRPRWNDQRTRRFERAVRCRAIAHAVISMTRDRNIWPAIDHRVAQVIHQAEAVFDVLAAGFVEAQAFGDGFAKVRK